MEQAAKHNALTPAASPPDVAISDRGGPKLTAPSPAVMPHPIESSVEDFKMFISLVFSVSIFGASTFAVVVGQMTDPADIWKPNPPPFTLSTIRNFIAIAWLCFVLSIAVAGYSSSLLTIQRDRVRGDYDDWAKKWESIGILASTVLHLLLVTAFLFLSLSIVPYACAVGWVAVGFSGIACVFVISLSGYQFWTHLNRS
ncbi:hypothetical protein EDB80DRAFT_877853 [Ilyonectria destructans]|nr:hypothetical protein EDB80DRAFT_877853 [Ilyonectria destructans]